ncbi:MAG: hypothetical protein QM706_14910 [Nitrospira sp.]
MPSANLLARFSLLICRAWYQKKRPNNPTWQGKKNIDKIRPYTTYNSEPNAANNGRGVVYSFPFHITTNVESSFVILYGTIWWRCVRHVLIMIKSMDMKVFGKYPAGSRLERIQRSPQYKGGIFENTEKTETLSPDVSYIRLFRDFVSRPSDVNPPKPLPSVKSNLSKPPFSTPTVTWFGHFIVPSAIRRIQYTG